eukprot:gene1286-164_t
MPYHGHHHHRHHGRSDRRDFNRRHHGRSDRRDFRDDRRDDRRPTSSRRRSRSRGSRRPPPVPERHQNRIKSIPPKVKDEMQPADPPVKRSPPTKYTPPPPFPPSMLKHQPATQSTSPGAGASIAPTSPSVLDDSPSRANRADVVRAAIADKADVSSALVSLGIPEKSVAQLPKSFQALSVCTAAPKSTNPDKRSAYMIANSVSLVNLNPVLSIAQKVGRLDSAISQVFRKNLSFANIVCALTKFRDAVRGKDYDVNFAVSNEIDLLSKTTAEHMDRIDKGLVDVKERARIVSERGIRKAVQMAGNITRVSSAALVSINHGVHQDIENSVAVAQSEKKKTLGSEHVRKGRIKSHEQMVGKSPNSDESNANSDSKVQIRQPKADPVVEKKYLKGITNPGNFCYGIAQVHMLDPIVKSHLKESVQNCLAAAWIKVTRKVLASEEQAVFLKSKMGPFFESNNQQDANEAYDEIAQQIGYDDLLFNCHRTLTCSSCGSVHTENMKIPSAFYQVPVDGLAKFENVSGRSGSQGVFCQRCCCEKQHSYSDDMDAPACAYISFNRSTDNLHEKNMKAVECPSVWQGKVLVGVIYHSGEDFLRGHYVAKRRIFTSTTSRWEFCDDQQIEPCDDHKMDESDWQVTAVMYKEAGSKELKSLDLRTIKMICQHKGLPTDKARRTLVLSLQA